MLARQESDASSAASVRTHVQAQTQLGEEETDALGPSRYLAFGSGLLSGGFLLPISQHEAFGSIGIALLQVGTCNTIWSAGFC